MFFIIVASGFASRLDDIVGQGILSDGGKVKMKCSGLKLTLRCTLCSIICIGSECH